MEKGKKVQIKFPKKRPGAFAAFRRPEPGSSVGVNPPGFCWWRAGDNGKVFYKINVEQDGKVVYSSEPTADPVHVPDKVFPPGEYRWWVDAYDAEEELCDSTEKWSFHIEEKLPESPFEDVKAVLKKISLRGHPRLQLPDEDLGVIRKRMATQNPASLEMLLHAAEDSLDITPPAEPDFSGLEGSELRMNVIKVRDECISAHNWGMVLLARAYVLNGDERFGQKAKEFLLNIADWDIDGDSSIMAAHGDAPGLDLIKHTAETLDAVWNLLTRDELEKVVKMCAARIDQALVRLIERHDYLASPGDSHAGRIPTRMLEHAIVLSDHPRAAVWAEYALKSLRTSCPHWAGPDGGWAEGIPYGSLYNSYMLPGFRAWYIATDQQLDSSRRWEGIAEYLFYGYHPTGQLRPFGDMEYKTVDTGKGQPRFLSKRAAVGSDNLYNHIPACIQYMAASHQEQKFKKMAEMLPNKPGISWLKLLDYCDFSKGVNIELPQDKRFKGVGHAFMHSDLGNWDNDIFVAFRSSPYGALSHSHASQNDFIIQYGGEAVVSPGGIRFPYHNSAFHTEYIKTSAAHNTILVDGEGQVYDGGDEFAGKIVDFKSEKDYCSVTGEAAGAYNNPALKSFLREVRLLRKGVVVITDTIETSKPVSIDWLLHVPNKPEKDGLNWRLGGKSDASLQVSGADFVNWTNEWPVSPMKGIEVEMEPPEPIWHSCWKLKVSGKTQVTIEVNFQ